MTADDLFLSAIKALTQPNLSIAEVIGTAEQLKKAGREDLILQLYALWIRSNPDHPLLHVIHFNLAVVQSESGDLPGAKLSLETAMTRHPDFYPAYINLGSLLEKLEGPHEAIAQWSALVARLAPISGAAIEFKLSGLKQIGRVLETHHFSAKAEEILRQSLEIDPDQADVMQHYVALRLAQCKWPILVPWEGVERKRLMKGIGPLSMAIFTDDPVLQLASAWNYNKHVIGYPSDALQPWIPENYATKTGKRKIGYISSDLRNHAVGFIMAELFELHDRGTFEVFAYYCGPAMEDALQERIRGTVDHWCNINGMSDEAAAERIRTDGVDILIDVNGYTKDARTKVFALKPAPVLVNWLGYPGSMASPYHHYIIADAWIIPPEYEQYYTEKVMHLPCYQPNDRRRIVSAHRPSRAEAGLPETGTVFCMFNGIQKVSRFAFERWLAILARVPGSVLWLLHGSEETDQRLKDYAAAHGIAPERIIIADKRHNPEHLARYPLADLFLDTGAYGAHVTASDSLWMGVPVITVSGRAFAARVCGSLCRAAGLGELVCADADAFVERAVQIGSDPEEIARLKKKLADNRDSCTLFDTDKTVRALEGLYAAMWQDFLDGSLPKPDLRNLDLYLRAGCEIDHEATELLVVENYEELYKDKFAAWHRYAPIPEDALLWTRRDIDAAETVPSS